MSNVLHEVKTRPFYNMTKKVLYRNSSVVTMINNH